MLERAIQLEPAFVEAHGALADALDGEGRYPEAAAHYEAALAKQPDNASLLNNLAWLRAACPDAAIRNGDQAVKLALRACELTGYSKPIFIGTLAAAQAETGEFQAAIATATQAATLAEMLHLPETAARNRELIELYRQGRAAHGSAPGGL
jgi:serine/threonine-protein kinase